MPFQQKDNSFALFPNDRKTKDTFPDWTGTATIICVHCGEKEEVYLNAWAKSSKGKDYFSGSIRRKVNDNGAQPEPEKPKSNVRSIKTKTSPAPK